VRCNCVVCEFEKSQACHQLITCSCLLVFKHQSFTLYVKYAILPHTAGCPMWLMAAPVVQVVPLPEQILHNVSCMFGLYPAQGRAGLLEWTGQWSLAGDKLQDCRWLIGWDIKTDWCFFVRSSWTLIAPQDFPLSGDRLWLRIASDQNSHIT
jgi:hypothetical protein